MLLLESFAESPDVLAPTSLADNIDDELIENIILSNVCAGFKYVVLNKVVGDTPLYVVLVELFLAETTTL